MKLKISAAMVSIALLTACGGGGGDDTGSVGDTPDNNPVTEPRSNVPTGTGGSTSVDGVISSDSSTLKSNGADLFSDTGAQTVNADRVVSWPGLRYGSFLVANNPWNASAASYTDWYQDISLYENASGYGVEFDWDWGASGDTNGSVFDTKSYPEVIYGTKSAGEISGTYDETGLPVEIYNSPAWTIDYNFGFEGRRSDSGTAGGTDAEFNVAIESFYHSTCDIKRNGLPDDNVVFETMVWLKMGDRKPSGAAPIDVVTTSDGRSYDVYTKSSNRAYVAFVAHDRDTSTSGTVMYSELLNIAQDNAVQYDTYPLKSTDCLANILMGTEIWHGAGTFNLNQYRINRSY